MKYSVFLISVLSLLHAVKSEDKAKTKCKKIFWNCVFDFLKTKRIQFHYISISSTVQTCDAAKATPGATGCPKGSNCIENGTVDGVLLSYCVCAANFTVNQNFSATDNNSQYCIEKASETHPTESSTPQPPKVSTVVPSTTLKAETTTTKAKTTESAPTTTAAPAKPEVEEKADVKVAPAPEPHHAITGILVPILIVLGFLGGVFLIRKYNVIERAHGHIRNRSQQTPRYNGLMENDFDDDPLLI